jgi:hypothetical protein
VKRSAASSRRQQRPLEKAQPKDFLCIGLRKKRDLPLADIQPLCRTLINTCEVYDLSVRAQQTALTLVERYSLPLYGANIVAAGLSDCAILYSQHMQDGLNIRAIHLAPWQAQLQNERNSSHACSWARLPQELERIH